MSFCSGDFAQNIIYQTVSIWLLFFYTNVYGLAPSVAAVMFLVVRIVDVIWDPIVGAFIDKSNPRWGKYRSWLLLSGVPLAGFAILCFWNGFSGSLLYAYITYIGLCMCNTLINVPYGALNSSLTRDVDEITILTSVRMVMNNIAALLVKTLPLVIAIFAPKVLDPETGRMVAQYNTPDAAHAWFITMTIFSVFGLLLLIYCFTETHEKVVMDKDSSEGVKVSDVWMEFIRNRPLRILAFFFIIAFTMMSVSNAADSYFMVYNIGADTFMTTAFMWLGTIPAFIFMPLVPAIKRRLGKNGMFKLFIGLAIFGMLLMYLLVSFPATRSQFWLLCVAQFIKSTGVVVATGYMWALVPEVVTYSEYTTGRRVAAIVNAIMCLFMKAGMAFGGVIPGFVLAWVGFNAQAQSQPLLAEQGILWLVTVIPAILLLLGMFVISRYELTDERMDEINAAISDSGK
ncbi:MAG: MFS transporter [Bacteroidia bacterium]|nr:MFS transporter [Bacteroidia bacterium]